MHIPITKTFGNLVEIEIYSPTLSLCQSGENTLLVHQVNQHCWTIVPVDLQRMREDAYNLFDNPLGDFIYIVESNNIAPPHVVRTTQIDSSFLPPQRTFLHLTPFITIAQSVSHGRSKLGMSVKELASLSQLPESTLNRLEKGMGKDIAIEEIMRVANALGLSVEIAIS